MATVIYTNSTMWHRFSHLLFFQIHTLFRETLKAYLHFLFHFPGIMIFLPLFQLSSSCTDQDSQLEIFSIFFDPTFSVSICTSTPDMKPALIPAILFSPKKSRPVPFFTLLFSTDSEHIFISSKWTHLPHLLKRPIKIICSTSQPVELAE